MCIEYSNCLASVL